MGPGTYLKDQARDRGEIHHICFVIVLAPDSVQGRYDCGLQDAPVILKRRKNQGGVSCASFVVYVPRSAPVRRILLHTVAEV